MSPSPGVHRSATWSSRVLPRLLLGVLAVLLVAVAGLTVRAVLAGAEPGAGSNQVPEAPGGATAQVVADVGPAVEERRAPGSRARRVLHRWDARRAQAWAHGDLRDLRALYSSGSAAGRHDVAMLRAWADRGLRVRGLRVQLLAVRVLDRAPDRLLLRVTDRVVDGRAGAPGRGWVPLPGDRPTTRRVRLQRTDGRWRVAAVTTAQPAR